MATSTGSVLRRRLALGAWGVLVFVVAWYCEHRVGPARPTIRVYDVRDLLVDAPDYDQVPYMGLGATRGTAFATTAPVTVFAKRGGVDDLHDRPIDDLVRIILNSVEPKSWEGGVGIISVLRGRLVITQTPAAQEQIQKLLRDLYAAQQVQIIVEARLISLDEEAVLSLPPALRRRSGITAFEEAGDAEELSEMEVNLILNASVTQGSSVTTYPRMTIFNGQRAYVLTSTQRAYIAGIVESRSADGKTTRTTHTDVANSGVLLDVRATASADHERVTLALRPEMAELLSAKPSGQVGAVQLPIVDYKSIATTVSVRTGKTCMVGGFANPDAGASAATRPALSGKKMFLLIKPTVIAPAVDPNAGVFPRPE